MLSREESRGWGHCGHRSRSWEMVLLQKVVSEASESDQNWEINTDLWREAEHYYDAGRQLCFYWFMSKTVGEHENERAEVQRTWITQVDASQSSGISTNRNLRNNALNEWYTGSDIRSLEGIKDMNDYFVFISQHKNRHEPIWCLLFPAHVLLW